MPLRDLATDSCAASHSGARDLHSGCAVLGKDVSGAACVSAQLRQRSPTLHGAGCSGGGGGGVTPGMETTLLFRWHVE